MTTIDINAQQIVVDALAKNPKNNQKTILCHTPSKLSAEPGMYLSTQDRLQELFTSGHDSVVAIFPNASLVRRLCKNCQQDTFSIELVFACHASCDPNDLVIDLLGKFAVFVNSSVPCVTRTHPILSSLLSPAPPRHEYILNGTWRSH